MLDIPKIELKFLLSRKGVASVDLRPAGDARFDFVPPRLFARVAFPIRTTSDRTELAAALDLLKYLSPVEPARLATELGKRRDLEVSTQWLSKKLKRLGIEAKKCKGKRVFSVSEAEIQRARSELGIAPLKLESGQQGHQGQQDPMNEEEILEVVPLES